MSQKMPTPGENVKGFSAHGEDCDLCWGAYSKALTILAAERREFLGPVKVTVEKPGEREHWASAAKKEPGR